VVTTPDGPAGRDGATGRHHSCVEGEPKHSPVSRRGVSNRANQPPTRVRTRAADRSRTGHGPGGLHFGCIRPLRVPGAAKAQGL